MNEEAAQEALEAWPHKLQIGGGITLENAALWLNESAAEKVIVTSHIFENAKFSRERLRKLVECTGKKSLVLYVFPWHLYIRDLSCKRRNDAWIVAMDKWETLTDLTITQESIGDLQDFCSEFLVHAADVEGLCKGIDRDLVSVLGKWCSIPCTYAGGANDISDIELVDRLSNGSIDLTYGSALDIFGGTGVTFQELVAYNRLKY